MTPNICKTCSMPHDNEGLFCSAKCQAQGMKKLGDEFHKFQKQKGDVVFESDDAPKRLPTKPKTKESN